MEAKIGVPSHNVFFGEVITVTAITEPKTLVKFYSSSDTGTFLRNPVKSDTAGVAITEYRVPDSVESIDIGVVKC